MATLVGGCNSAVDFSSRPSRVDQSLPCMSVSMLYWSTVVGSSRGVQAVNVPVMVRGTNLRSRERYFFQMGAVLAGDQPLEVTHWMRLTAFELCMHFSSPPSNTQVARFRRPPRGPKRALADP